jgi:predicted ATPase/DNA-binding XRE family transcriptional regulator
MPLSERFGDVLRRHRLREGLSQELLAEKARLSLTAVGALERGTRRAPYRETVLRLAEALGLDGTEREAFQESARSARRKSDAATGESRNHHLPVSRTSFVGREDDISAVNDLLKRSRLVTLVGSGGIGKTRLSLAVAGQPPNDRWGEAWFVDLSLLDKGAYVVEAIASTVLPSFSRSINTVEALAQQLTERRMLLLLDNCEHVVGDVVVAVHAILLTCPNVTILATSRERLRVEGEAWYRVPSLAVPDHAPETLETAAHVPVLDLFMQRSRANDPRLGFTRESLQTIVKICRRLDGIPLAIELAASRVGILGLRSLLERLDEYLALPGATIDVPARHRTVLATVAWSCDLLEKPERDLLFRLSVFTGFTLEAAEALCPEQPRGRVLQLLSSLIDRSLVTVVHAADRARYVLLESVRAYGRGQLERLRRRTVVCRRHAQWIAGIADHIGAGGQQMSYETFQELIPEVDNARAALTWAFEADVMEDRVLGARIICGLRALWRLSNRKDEYRRWIEAGLAKIDEARHPLIVAELLRNAMLASFYESSVLVVADRAHDLFERHGDARSCAIFHLTAMHVYSTHRRLDLAESSCDRALELLTAQSMLSTMWYVSFLNNRAILRIEQSRFEEAKADSLAAAELATALGDEYFAVSRCLPRLYQIEMERGNFYEAVSWVDRMMRSRFATAPEIEIQGLEMLMLACAMLNDVEKGAPVARRLLERTRGETVAWHYIGAIVALRDDGESSATLMGFVDAVRALSPLVHDVFIERSYEIIRTTVNSRLPADVVAARSVAGAALTSRQACNLALAVLK